MEKIITIRFGVLDCETIDEAVEQAIDVLKRKAYKPEAITLEDIKKK